MHHRAHFLGILFLAIIKYLPDSHRSVLFQQQSPPPPRLAHALLPPRNLPRIILAPPAEEEATVPLKPTPHIVLVIDPPTRLPLFNALSTRDTEFVHLGTVYWVSQHPVHIQPRDPRRRQLLPVVSDGDAEVPRVQRPEIGAAEAAFAEDLFGRFVGREVVVIGESKGAVGVAGGR